MPVETGVEAPPLADMGLGATLGEDGSKSFKRSGGASGSKRDMGLNARNDMGLNAWRIKSSGRRFVGGQVHGSVSSAPACCSAV